MYSTVTSAAPQGIEAAEVVVEADVSDGLPALAMVGYLASEVREAQDRVRTALRSIGSTLPARRITINLSPANLRKEGNGFDLPIATAILLAMDELPSGCTEGILLVGELGLNGQIRPVRGVMQIVASAQSFGCHTCIVPMANLAEGSLIGRMQVLGAEKLADVVAYLRGEGKLAEQKTDLEQVRAMQEKKQLPDFADIRGQENVRRAAEVAVAGFHNLLIIGPPGSGKSMTAKRLPSILPRPTTEEILEITRIHSIAGELPPEGVMACRPFRAPHHTISASSLIGGGRHPKPGEISLAHRGVLFLDELTEFPQFVLDTLRQPMEDGRVTVSRVAGSSTYPASFILAAACNPCKCGYWPDRKRCHCTPAQVHRYLEHISQPFLDRMDICVEAKEPEFDQLGSGGGECSADIRGRVEKAVAVQKERYAGTNYRFNADLSLKAAERYGQFGKEEKAFLHKIYQKMNLTGRSYLKVLRVARTLADLDGEECVRVQHLAEAVSYRSPDRTYWSGEW